jgi:soluble lytic murein transglycosylase
MARKRKHNLARLGDWISLALILGAVGSATFVYLRWQMREQRYNKLILQIGTQYKVDPFLIKAVMRKESSFDPFAKSSKGAIGLMQIMPATGMDWARAKKLTNFSPTGLWNERNNIEAGAWYLRRALNYWESQGITNATAFALAEYNAGRGNVLRWLPSGMSTSPDEMIAAISIPGVRHYVVRVLEFQEMYQLDGKL